MLTTVSKIGSNRSQQPKQTPIRFTQPTITPRLCLEYLKDVGNVDSTLLLLGEYSNDWGNAAEWYGGEFVNFE